MSKRFLVVMLFSTGVCLVTVAGDGMQLPAEPYCDTIHPATDRQHSEPNIVVSMSEPREATHRYTARNGTEERREQPDYTDVPYGPHERNTLDIWRTGNQTPTPLVVYYHGGGFSRGDKRSIRQRLLNSLLAAGISVAAVNYRLSGSAPYPAQMHDAARALQFLRYHATRYNIDPDRIGASGVSAGGGISLWLAFHDDMADPDNKDPIARQSTRISAAVVYETQTTYDPRKIMELFNTSHVDEALIPFFGMQTSANVEDPRYYPLFSDASPINHLSADDVPVMLYYSQADIPLKANTLGKEHIHHPRFGHLLKEKMDQFGIKCVLKLREGYRNASSNIFQDSVNFFTEVFNYKYPPDREQ